jgi:hypothetical protein
LKVKNDTLPLALISVYGPPDNALLQLSHKTVYSCQYLSNDNLRVINARSIRSVIAIVPHEVTLPGKTAAEDRWFVVEKPGLEAAELGGGVEDNYEPVDDEE